MRKQVFFWFVVFAIFFSNINVMAEDLQEDTGKWSDQLLEQIELDEVEQWIHVMLPEEKLDFKELVRSIWKQEELFSKDEMVGKIQEILLYQFKTNKKLWIQLILLLLTAAIFRNISSVFEKNQIEEMSFYMVYLVMFLLITQSFSLVSEEIVKKLDVIVGFMRGLAPSYYMVLTAAGGMSQAFLFYQMILLLVWLIQWIILKIVLPLVNLYVLLSLLNDISKEEILGKFSEFLKDIIVWSLKTMMGLVTGLQIIKNLVAPVMDTLKRSLLGKTASAIPGVGNAVNTITEIVLTSAILVRNSMGAAFLIILFLWGLEPVFHLGIMMLFYKFLAAVFEPISDKRLVDAISIGGDGIQLLLKVFLTILILCMVTITILTVSFGG